MGVVTEDMGGSTEIGGRRAPKTWGGTEDGGITEDLGGEH